MLAYADVCWRMLTYADVCWRMLTYADVCWRMLTYADVCWCMLTYADVCWRMLTYADVCWRMLTYADVCCCGVPCYVGILLYVSSVYHYLCVLSIVFFCIVFFFKKKSNWGHTYRRAAPARLWRCLPRRPYCRHAHNRRDCIFIFIFFYFLFILRLATSASAWHAKRVCSPIVGILTHVALYMYIYIYIHIHGHDMPTIGEHTRLACHARGHLYFHLYFILRLPRWPLAWRMLTYADVCWRMLTYAFKVATFASRLTCPQLASTLSLFVFVEHAVHMCLIR
jgi:hypothetical protein